MTSTRRPVRWIRQLLLLGILFPPTVLVSQEPTSDRVAVEKPTALSTDRIDCERVPVGAADDYKPCVAQLPGGELLLTAFHQHKKDGNKVLEQTLLYRQESIFARQGWPVSRTRLCDLVAACATLLDPIYRAMIVRLKESFAIHADESPVRLLQPRRTAYAWLYLGDALNPYTLFDFTPGRGEEYPAAFLSGYAGFVHADGYTGYNPIHGSGARHLGCWAHVRRKFVEAQTNHPAKASEALAYIRTLYAVEKEIVDETLTCDSAVSRRQARAGPILHKFGDWLEVEQRTALPKSPFGLAVSYARNQWPTLGRYLDDARFTIGRVERWRGGLGQAHPLPALSSAGASLA